MAGCCDYVGKYEHPRHVSPTANHLDAIAAVEIALTDYQAMFGHPLVDECSVDLQSREILPVLTLVTDIGGPFRAFRFETFILQHADLRRVRTRVKSLGQNGSRERGFGCLKYERLYLQPIDYVLDLVRHAEEYRVDYNTIRPHEAIAWNTPLEIHLGLGSPTIPTVEPAKILQASWHGTMRCWPERATY